MRIIQTMYVADLKHVSTSLHFFKTAHFPSIFGAISLEYNLKKS